MFLGLGIVVVQISYLVRLDWWRYLMKIGVSIIGVWAKWELCYVDFGGLGLIVLLFWFGFGNGVLLRVGLCVGLCLQVVDCCLG